MRCPRDFRATHADDRRVFLEGATNTRRSGHFHSIAALSAPVGTD